MLPLFIAAGCAAVASPATRAVIPDPRTACVCTVGGCLDRAAAEAGAAGAGAGNGSARGVAPPTASQAAAARAIVAEMDSLAVWPDMTMKLTHPEFGPDGGWSAELARVAIREYARYMALSHVFGRVVPSKVIDEVWHAHILDTQRYGADCERIFGRFVHHYPYFGMGGGHGSHQLLVDTYGRTLTRYAAIFGELPPAQVWGESRFDDSDTVVADPKTACVCTVGGCLDQLPAVVPDPKTACVCTVGGCLDQLPAVVPDPKTACVCTVGWDRTA